MFCTLYTYDGATHIANCTIRLDFRHCQETLCERTKHKPCVVAASFPAKPNEIPRGISVQRRRRREERKKGKETRRPKASFICQGLGGGSDISEGIPSLRVSSTVSLQIITLRPKKGGRDVGSGLGFCSITFSNSKECSHEEKWVEKQTLIGGKRGEKFVLSRRCCKLRQSSKQNFDYYSRKVFVCVFCFVSPRD